jgi:predicted secreted acid phosphatase
MSRRLTAVPAALLLAALLLLTATAALAATTRTAAAPDQLRAGHAAYETSVARGWTKATKLLDAQLAKHPKKPTVVLDIDETTMSNWSCLDAAGFELSGLATCVVKSASVAFPGAKAFIKHARAKKVAIAFITGAPQAACALRQRNLIAQGIKKPFTLTCRPAGDTSDTIVPYKSAARKALIKKGATIVLNVGDQQSDLSGGAARKTYKLPNPIYTIS